MRVLFRELSVVNVNGYRFRGSNYVVDASFPPSPLSILAALPNNVFSLISKYLVPNIRPRAD